MRSIDVELDKEVINFVEKAAIKFIENPKWRSYTDGEIKSGCFFALRYGLDNNGVVVFKLDEDFEPLNYVGIIDYMEEK